MKASEVIKQLERLAGEDDPEVVVSVGSNYKSSFFAYEEIFGANRYTGKEIRLCVSLDKKFIVREKKEN